MAFEEVDTDDDTEFIVLGAGETAPAAAAADDGNTVISRDELKRLQNAAEDRASVKDLFNTIQQSTRQPANVPLAADVQTDAEFAAQIEEDLLATGKTTSSINRAIDRKMAPVLAHYEKQVAGLQRQLAAKNENLSGVMSKYGDEVDAELAKIPAVQRTTPEAYEYVVSKVRNAHFQDFVNEGVAAALAAQGAAAEPAAAGKPAVRKTGQDAGRMAAGGVQKRQVFINDAMRKEAAAQHMSVEEYARRSAK